MNEKSVAFGFMVGFVVYFGLSLISISLSPEYLPYLCFLFYIIIASALTYMFNKYNTKEGIIMCWVPGVMWLMLWAWIKLS